MLESVAVAFSVLVHKVGEVEVGVIPSVVSVSAISVTVSAWVLDAEVEVTPAVVMVIVVPGAGWEVLVTIEEVRGMAMMMRRSNASSHNLTLTTRLVSSMLHHTIHCPSYRVRTPHCHLVHFQSYS